MIRHLTLVLLIIGLLGSSAHANDSLQVTIAPYAGRLGEGEGELATPSLRRTSPENKTDYFHVLITNISDQPQRIWVGGYSWGWGNLRFEITDEKGATTIASRKPRMIWRANVDAFWPLKPKEVHVFDVYLSDPEEWTGFPAFGPTAHIYTIRAIYEIKEDRSSKQDGVWDGKITSSPVRVYFADY